MLDVAKLVIAEGCLGETVAAVEALEAAEATSDVALRAAYTRIAADEQRHAELAFRFLRWASQQAPAELGALIEDALTRMPDSPAVRGVVAPCLRALLAAAGPQGPKARSESPRSLGRT